MKKVLSRLLCISMILMIGLMPVLALAELDTGYCYVNTNDYNGLNLRDNPGKDGTKVICKLPHRAYILIYEFNGNHTWAYVEAQNPKGSGTVKGWCSVAYLSKKDPGPVHGGGGGGSSDTIKKLNDVAKKIQYLGLPMESMIITKNIGACVHLRAFPDTRAIFYGEYYANTPVKLLALSDKWALIQVEEDNKVGYILADNVICMLNNAEAQ